MNAMLGALRATFRLKGTLLFWCFYTLMLGFAVLILLFSADGKGAYVAISSLSFCSWLGWFLFFPRLWQLQRHAESAQLPAARTSHERATLMLCLLGTALPAGLLSALGADPLWAWLGPVLSMSVALLYLVVSPAVGVGLIVASSLLPMLGERYAKFDLASGEYSTVLFILLATGTLAYGAFRWRKVMLISADSGWNTPQIVRLSERADLSLTDPGNDPAQHWASPAASLIGERLGPDTPTRSLAILLCGPLAPLGWKNYLRNAAWMSAAILLLTLISLSEPEGSRRGPSLGLLVLLGIWALAIPASLITRLRQDWSSSGQALAEAFLLPGMVRPRLSWLQVMQAVLFTALYRLSLPALLVFTTLTYTTGDMQAGTQTLLVSLWAMLLSVTLLPLSQNLGGPATFLLYGLLGLIVIGLIGTHLVMAQHGPWPIPGIAPIVSAVVLVGAAAGGLLPRSQSPFALP